jgi:uncharacterized membrane protein
MHDAFPEGRLELPMTTDRLESARASTATGSGARDSLSGHVSQNIDSIVAFHEREQRKVGGAQRRLERLSGLMARPLYLVLVLIIVALWVIGNVLAAHFGFVTFDPPPFSRLQGLLTLAALLTTTVVLISQRRDEKLDSQRAHLDLQVNLLTEQKVTKLILLLEELRRDLPMVVDRHDPEAAAMQRRTDTTQMLSAIEEVAAASRGKGIDAPAQVPKA